MSDVSQTTSTASAPVSATPKKDSSTGKVVIACCLVIVALLCLCCGALFVLFGATAASGLAVYNEVQTSLLNVCNGKETDLRDFYDNVTSKEFKKVTTYSEFKTFFNQYKNIILDCNELKNGTFLNSKLNGLQVNAETRNGTEFLTIQFESKLNRVIAEFVQEGSAWKLNSIQVK